MIATLQAICYLVIFELLSPPEIKKDDDSLLVSVFQKYCYQLVMKMATPFHASRCSSIMRFFPHKVKK